MPSNRPSVRNVAKKIQRPNVSSTWDPEGRLRFGLNGFTLVGIKRDGAWKFECKDFPELESKSDLQAVVCEFFARAVG
jgi:hypothetical protein